MKILHFFTRRPAWVKVLAGILVLLGVVCVGYLASPHRDRGCAVPDDTHRLLLSRQALFDGEASFMRQFCITYKDPVGSADLYFLGHQLGKQMEFVPLDYQELHLFVPHNKNYGSPYYELTPFDIDGARVQYGEIDPCPEGCLAHGGLVYGHIYSDEPHATARLVNEYLKEYQSPEGDSGEVACKAIAVNEQTQGTVCSGQDWFQQTQLIIESAHHTYTITDWTCDIDNPSRSESCKRMLDSIRVE